MAVTINTTTINEINAEYPVPGVDNDSQGFRDNFSGIKESLQAAAADLELLDQNTAKLNDNNDFNGNDLSEANFVAVTEEVYNSGSISTGQNVSFLNGHYQIVGVSDDLTLTLADWPTTGKVGKMRVVLKKSGDDASYTVTWSTQGGGTIKNDGSSEWAATDPALTLEITSKTNPKVVDFWTDDGGLSVYAHYVGEFT